MRVVHLSESAIPSTTANSMQVMKMCQAMAQEGHDVTLLAPAGWDDRDKSVLPSLWRHYSVAPIFRIRWLPSPRPYPNYSYGLLAGAYCRLARSDVVFARHLPGAVVAARIGCRVVFEAHDVPSAHGRLGWALSDVLVRQPGLERVVVTSGALGEYLVGAWPLLLPASKVVVAPNGVDLERFDNLPRPSAARARVGVGAESRPMAGYMGHLYRGRGVDLLVELARRVPGVDFLIVGGTDEDVAATRQLVDRQQARNVTVVGFVPNADLPLHLAACDVLLMPHQRRVASAGGGGEISRWTSPLKMFEYLAAGRPILASGLPVLREVLSDENAILLEPDDVDGWAAALKRVVDDPALAERLASQARRDAQRFSWRRRAAFCLAGLNGERQRRTA